jgi:lysophospholipase L1-like esterase
VTLTGNATATTYMDAIAHYNGDESAGVRLFDGGHYGWNTSLEYSDLNGNNDNNHYLARVPQIAPKLAIIFLQLNDYQSQVALATFASNYANIISLLSGWATGISVLMIAAFRRTDIAVQPITNAQYTAQLQTIAAGNPDYGFLDLQPLWDANGGTAVLCPSDGVHPNNTGHALIGNYVASYLLSVFQSQSGFLSLL